MFAGTALSSRHARFLAFLFTASLFLAAITLGLLVPIYSGLLVYAAVMHLSAGIVRDGHITARAKWLSVATVAGIVVTAFLLAGLGLHVFLRNGAGVHDLLLKMGEILASASAWLPDWASEAMPQQGDLLATLGDWFKTHAAEIGTFGLGAVKVVGYALIGMLLGTMVAIKDATRAHPLGPVSERLLVQVEELRDAFWRVASAQLKISAVNTSLTAVYLLIALPLCGIHLPLTKTLIAVTFMVGLLPIVGNLISNTAITVISLSLSFQVGLASLAFLILVHKLEYFVNARIVGTQINARAWELLLWMLLMERLFGPAGVVAAPVFYSWLKAEWHCWDTPPAALPEKSPASTPAEVREKATEDTIAH